jgi:hypothetical protein
VWLAPNISASPQRRGFYQENRSCCTLGLISIASK